MKKYLIAVLTACVASTTANHLIATSSSSSKIEEKNENLVQNLNKNDNIINKLDQKYFSLSDENKEEMKQNLIDSITFENEKIVINYENLNKELYDGFIYKEILSQNYLNILNMQLEMGFISFGKDNHIIFNENINQYNSYIWAEHHWYWFSWWKLHLSQDAIWDIIEIGMSVATKAWIISAIVKLLTPYALPVILTIAAFLATSIAIIIYYKDNAKGCWIGIFGLLPDMGWGSN